MDAPIFRYSLREEQGLGLAVVKQPREKHGGQVWVESEYGKGSAFHFTLLIDTPASELVNIS